jgi:hypothetical protein
VKPDAVIAWTQSYKIPGTSTIAAVPTDWRADRSVPGLLLRKGWALSFDFFREGFSGRAILYNIRKKSTVT